MKKTEMAEIHEVERLVKRIQSLGLSQSEFSSLVGWAQSSGWRWLNFHRALPRRELDKADQTLAVLERQRSTR